MDRPKVGASPAATPATTGAVPVPASERSSMFEALRIYPSVRWLTTGALSTTTGHGMYQVALGWLALELTDSAFFVGLTGFFGGIPILIFGPPSGVVSDRFDRRKVLMAGQLGLLLSAALLASLIATDLINRWTMLVLAFTTGTSMAFVFPAKHALLAFLVRPRDLANAVALNSAGQNASRIFGPSLAGVLIALVGVGTTFAVAAGLQALALFTSTRLPENRADRSKQHASPFRSFIEGIKYVGRDPAMTGTLLLATIGTILIMPYVIMMPVFARDELNLGASGLGLLMAGIGLGSVVGALMVAGFSNLVTVRGIQLTAVTTWALSVILFAQTPSVLPAAVLLALSGLLSAIFLATNQTILQLRSDEAVRGRVLGVMMVTWGLMPIGVLLVGSLADRIGAPDATTILSVIALLLILVVAWRIPELWRRIS